ncbi:GNAT family N-acetyltransferase [Mucilaginibacter sp. JRF]|uniref:GNAT family N-acetyltransferase n=1 Tax=Mucilaginibacter sp. JRF TaxID=2780088 RepID=UPI00187EE563|nr:GNAT family N-acetyltransferase [Mucilaginibacter sp. JRF]MBE9584484.1 GNAT family N-acetyltransferase [Mucilaginibacter sp. JRF]
MNKRALKYLTFLSTSLSVVSGIAGLLSIQNKTQAILAFAIMAALAICGLIFFLKFKRYNNGAAYLQDCINAIQSPSEEWVYHYVQNEAELRSIWRISQDLYQEDNVDYNTVLSWWKCYPAGIFILCRNSNIVGYFSMWPIKEATFKQISSGRRRERELKRQSIIGKDSTEQRPYWYITNIVVQKKYRKTDAIKTLLREALRKWVNEGNLADDVKLCAFGYSKEGKALIKGFGFHELKSADETADNLPLYVFTSTNQNINILVNRLTNNTIPN